MFALVGCAREYALMVCRQISLLVGSINGTSCINSSKPLKMAGVFMMESICSVLDSRSVLVHSTCHRCGSGPVNKAGSFKLIKLDIWLLALLPPTSFLAL